ncbi:hypothetical protein IAQ61_006178 [Plenodomus lingam]|uniref:uncharacterized protein n=1 Tax=Leptosphaeria maculans TaxID=5022 RepID=UPI00331BB533|nr:hypothetical protein IAQ61_006178 [Plenodomus lingam]
MELGCMNHIVLWGGHYHRQVPYSEGFNLKVVLSLLLNHMELPDTLAIMAPPVHVTEHDESFLASCIYKGKQVRDIWESLGLFSLVNDVRKEPSFAIEEANELYKKIKRIARDFSQSYPDGIEQLQHDLINKPAFEKAVLDLGGQYGAAIWGRPEDSQGTVSRRQDAGIELKWEEERDREKIMFYIRCWITRLAVKEFSKFPRRPQKKSTTQSVEALDREQNTSGNSGLLRLSLAPVAHMLPRTHMTSQLPGESSKESAATHDSLRTNSDTNTSTTAPENTPTKSADSTTPSKRKAMEVDKAISNGKLPKARKMARPTQVSSFRQERQLYSISKSPTVIANRIAEAFARQRIRENSCNTDRTWRPRDETAEIETVADANEVPETEPDSTSLDSAISTEHNQPLDRYEQDEVIAGSTGIHQDPFRQDSVIPGDTQAETLRAASEPLDDGHTTNHANTNKFIDDDDQLPYRLPKRARLETTQEREHRTELFKLLLSYLNGINQFHPDTYSMEAEERMNMLLHQFHINDTERLQAKLGDDFARLQIAFESWMSMRHRLTGFRVATGYRGQPGEQWAEFLKQKPNVPCAYASLSYVGLQEAALKGEESYVVDTFDEDLAKMFDLLTMVKGCNGPEAFKGIGLYNSNLIGWFEYEGEGL